MRLGSSPEDAVAEVIGANSEIDAGIIALAVDGRAHAANTTYVQRRSDLGQAMIGSQVEGALVAVLHNAIRPHRPLAALAAEVALDVMKPADRPDDWIFFHAGVNITLGSVNAVVVDARGVVELMVIDNPKYLTGSWSLGVGSETKVLRHPGAFGAMIYEPYMIVKNGRLQSVDGQSELSVPIRSYRMEADPSS
jgi:hypothetical protein